MTTHKTIYVCSTCGENTAEWGTDEDWLIASVPESKTGEMVIRCPEHITEYAIRKAGGSVKTENGVKTGTVRNWCYTISSKA